MERFAEDGFGREKCVKCGWVHYHNPRPTVSAIISRHGKILLSHRLADPFKGMWDLPGGFMEEMESPENGVKRETREELGVEIEIKKLIGVFGPTQYPFGGQEGYNVDIYYQARIISGEPAAMTGSDVMEIKWFDPDKLPAMAFESNVKAIKVWKELLKTLRDRVSS
jgi:ADP-ribose pyrophosphatase YjhB (NUDIX family)